MGHAVIAIGNHRLNTTSIESLAADLAERYEATVQFGYRDDWIDEGTGKLGDCEFVELGRVEKGPALYILIDDFYMDKQHHSSRYNGEMYFNFYEKAHPRVTRLYLHQDSFHTYLGFGPGWWRWLHYFQGKFFHEPYIGTDFMKTLWKDFVDGERRSFYWQVKDFGGDTALYTDDCGPCQYIEDMIMTHPFEEAKQKLLADFGPEVLHVSSFQQNYSKGVFEEIDYKAFVDDFKDLEA